MKKHIPVFDYADHILNTLKKGVLLTAKADGKVNTMTISWGTLGIQWGKPIFTAFVRGSRYTSTFLDRNKEFTVNIPYAEVDKEILRICGTKSGRDMDKIRELGLTLEDPEVISVPGIREFPLTLECKVRYVQEQDLSRLEKPFLSRYYPQDVEGTFPGSNRDYHLAFYGEIVDAYIIS